MTSVVRTLGHCARPLFILLMLGLIPVTVRAQSHFSCLVGKGNIYNATVIITANQAPDIDGIALSTGSEIAVFSSDPSFADVCVGKLTWQESSGAIAVWGDDDLTSARDGIKPGEELLFRIWDNVSGLEHDVAPADVSYQNGGAYAHDAVFVLTGLSVSAHLAGLVANNDTAVTNEDEGIEIDVLANDNGGSSTLDPSSIAILDPPVNGVISSVDPTSGGITYVPYANFSGLDSFTYVVYNDNGSDSKTATVDVEIVDVNDAPTAAADVAITDEDQQTLISILANDRDVDDAVLDYASVVINTQPIYGDILTVDPTSGDVTYRPRANYHGQDYFTYTVLDPHGAKSEIVAVDITVSSVNDAPVAVADAAETDEDTQIKIRVLDNDADVDGDEIDPGSVQIRNYPANGSVESIHAASGTITYKPGLDFNGSDSFSYKVRDVHGKASDEVSVDINIKAINDAPKYVGHPVVSTPKGKRYNHKAKFTDADADAVTISALAVPSWMTITDNGDGTADLDGTPSDLDVGGHYVELFADDGLGGTITYNFTIVVADNAGPVAATDDVSVQEDDQIQIDVLSNDIDPEGDALDTSSIAIISHPTNGIVSLISSASGEIIYEPYVDFNGHDSFEYVVSDIYGNRSNIVQVSISVLPVSDAPSATNEIIEGMEDKEIIIDVLRNDLDADGDLLWISEANASGNADVLIGTDGLDITYIPSANFNGKDTFSYTVVDSDGLTSTATVTVMVAAVNDPPVVRNSPTATLSTGNFYTFAIEIDDVDGDPVSVSVLTAPSWLDLTVGGDGTNSLQGTPTVADLGLHDVILQISDGIVSIQHELTLVVSDIGSQLPERTVLLSPTWGATDIPTDTRFSWEPVKGATQYQLQVTRDSDPKFENLLFDRSFTYGASATITLVNYMVFNLPSDVRLFWRVRAQNDSGFSPWSDVSQYMTKGTGTSTPTETVDEIPTTAMVFQNYPNPFNPITTIRFDLAQPEHVQITIYNVIGQEIVRLVDGQLSGAAHEVSWDASGMPTGLYFYQLKAGSFSETKTMVLLK